MTDDTDKPPSRFTELTPAQRKFIRALGDSDLTTLMQVIRLFATLQGWCRVNRWVAYCIIGFAVWVATDVEKFKQLIFALFGATGKH